MRSSRTRRPAPARAPRRPRAARGSRDRVMEAACAEFAARGFEGAKVDRIARRAGLNKAMIYYHFRSKRALYLELVRSMLGAMIARVSPIADADLTPFEKLDAFAEALVQAGLERPDLPPIMLREIAEGGRHVEPESLKPIIRILGVMTRIIGEGTARGEFRPVDPLLIHLTTIWPVMVYLSTRPIQSKIAALARVNPARLSPAGFIRHLQQLNRRAVAKTSAVPRSPSRRAVSESAS